MTYAAASLKRRTLCIALATLPFASWGNTAQVAGLKRYGSGEFRYWGFLVYYATLWAGDNPMQPPLVLQLEYQRTIAGSAIAKASVDQMRQLGADDVSLARWSKQMQTLFPDVVPGDTIEGVYRQGDASFFHNGKLLGTVTGSDEPGFAPAFFGIWLDPATSAPALRAALLGQARP
jgi:hypothetical protein